MTHTCTYIHTQTYSVRGNLTSGKEEEEANENAKMIVNRLEMIMYVHVLM